MNGNAVDTAMEEHLEMDHAAAHDLYEYPDPDLFPQFSWIGQGEVQEGRIAASDSHHSFLQGQDQGVQDFISGVTHDGFNASDPDFDSQEGDMV